MDMWISVIIIRIRPRLTKSVFSWESSIWSHKHNNISLLCTIAKLTIIFISLRSLPTHECLQNEDGTAMHDSYTHARAYPHAHTRFEIRDSAFGIRDSKFEIREFENSRFEIRDSRFEIRNSRFEIRDSRFEIRDSRFKRQKVHARTIAQRYTHTYWDELYYHLSIIRTSRPPWLHTWPSRLKHRLLSDTFLAFKIINGIKPIIIIRKHVTKVKHTAVRWLHLFVSRFWDATLIIFMIITDKRDEQNYITF